MDLFLVQVSGLDVALTDSETSALDYAQQLMADDPTLDVGVLRIDQQYVQVLLRFPVAEAATA